MSKNRLVATVMAAALALLPGLATHAETIKYYHLDALGNVRVVTDQNGNVVERHDYLPFGQECTTGPCASNPGIAGAQPRKFTAKERDAETGLDYFGARYYAGKLGRFTTVDAAMTIDANLVDPQRWNRYAYAGNNPLRRVDADGRDWVDSTRGFIKGAATTYAGLVVAPFVAPYMSVIDPVGSARAPVEALQSLGHGLANADVALDQYVEMAGSQDPADNAALGEIFGGATVFAGAMVAPFAEGAAGTVKIGPKLGSAGGPGAGKAFSRATKDAARAESPTCVFCERPTVRPPGGTQSNIDHAIPKSRGGNNMLANAQNTCRDCNLAKGARTTEEFLDQP